MMTSSSKTTPQILAPISTGELFDKITILEIKRERIGDPSKVGNVENELTALRQTASDNGLEAFLSDPLVSDLRAINGELWDIEDGKRDCERRQAFGADFIALARKVYLFNDKRAAIKRAINEATGSAVVEEKSYAPYRPAGSGIDD